MTGKANRREHAPRVSAIIIFYNAERYFREAIDSVLAQDFADFELLLVDDGSTDSSTEIANAYQARDARVRYFDHPGHANRGMSASRNLGLSNARGDLIAFIDADDRWRPSKLSDQVELLDSMPGVDAVCGAVNFWASHDGGEDRVVPTGHVHNRPIASPEALLRVYPLGKADPPCPSDLLIRRPVIDAIGGFEEEFTGLLQLYEDQAFLAKFFLEGAVYFDHRVWLDYRLHDDSCTAHVNREQRQPEVRRYFLEWFGAYLDRTRHRFDPRIRVALMRALRPYRHPRLSAAGRRVKSLLRRAERA
jgi:glycosyltransferase involved in cell wall biosynthesis